MAIDSTLDKSLSCMWWYMPVIPDLGRQEDGEFKVSLSYMMSLRPSRLHETVHACDCVCVRACMHL